MNTMQWVKPTKENHTPHEKRVCCRTINSNGEPLEYYFTAQYDDSKKMYVSYSPTVYWGLSEIEVLEELARNQKKVVNTLLRDPYNYELTDELLSQKWVKCSERLPNNKQQVFIKMPSFAMRIIFNKEFSKKWLEEDFEWTPYRESTKILKS